MDLIELRQALRRWWVHGVAIALLVASVSVVATRPLDSQYSSSATLLVAPRVDRIETVTSGVLRVLLANVLAVARSRDLRDEIRPTLGEAANAEISIAGQFAEGSTVMKLEVQSPSAGAAIAWTQALSERLVEVYLGDAYLDVSVLDGATPARPPDSTKRFIDLTGLLLLAGIAGVLVIFALQRLQDSGDVAERVRRGGVPVMGELTLPARAHRPSFANDRQVAPLAMSLSGAPGVSERDRFVVLAVDTRTAVPVVDAIRAGLQQVGLQRLHKIALGPAVDDMPAIREAAVDGARFVAVLDAQESIDEFIRDVHVVLDAGFPVVGAVVIRRQVLRRRRRDRAAAPKRSKEKGDKRRTPAKASR